jgi:hypothetical protein
MGCPVDPRRRTHKQLTISNLLRSPFDLERRLNDPEKKKAQRRFVVELFLPRRGFHKWRRFSKIDNCRPASLPKRGAFLLGPFPFDRGTSPQTFQIGVQLNFPRPQWGEGGPNGPGEGSNYLSGSHSSSVIPPGMNL